MDRQCPPGPRGRLLVEAVQLLRRDPLSGLLKLQQTYGDIVHLNFGVYHVYVLSHPDYLHEMLVTHAEKLRKPRSRTRPVASFLGNGLLVSEGAFWKQQRLLMKPAFHHRYVHAYARVIRECIQHLLDTWQHDRVYDIDREMLKLTLPMVTKTLFGVDVQDTTGEIAEAIEVIQRISYQQGQLPLYLPEWLPTPHYREKRRAIEALDTVVWRIIRERQATGDERDDLLAMLQNAVDEHGCPLPTQQVRDEVMTVLLAGHESTANALTWTWYLLSQHPEVASRLRQELDAVLGGRFPTLEDLSRLPYNEMVIKEALRLYPPAWALPREPLEDIEIGGYPVKKGSLLIGAAYAVQRHPHYFADPHRFMPERFVPNGENAIPRFAYIPFGAGPRFCIGNAFALLAMQLTVASVAQRCDLTLEPSQQVVPDPLLTLRARYGMHMRVTVRAPAHA